ncbi:MAG: PTS sugar transporter subunit IIA [Myxococcaceae bacterium]|nr:PTS sugar transporter subunit IIA [Myxococcaceae bacterium]MCI0671829.1 PTS sugar transporter subunit IIA [Myxococcaceae bacterium]
MRFTDYLTEDAIRRTLGAGDQAGVLRELAVVLAAESGVPADTIERLLLERERTASTSVGNGVAIPHCRVPGLKRMTAGLGLHRRGVEFAGPGSPPVHIVVGVVSPPDTAGLHLKVLSRTAALLRSPTLRKALMDAPSAGAVRDILVRAEDEYIAIAVPRPGDIRTL